MAALYLGFVVRDVNNTAGLAFADIGNDDVKKSHRLPTEYHIQCDSAVCMHPLYLLV
jgi:hypothetical protein